MKCQTCGNTKEFLEFAYRDTKQPFTIQNGEPDWDTYDTTGGETWPSEIWCKVCYDAGRTTVVWKAGEPTTGGQQGAGAGKRPSRKKPVTVNATALVSLMPDHKRQNCGLRLTPV